MTFPPNCYKPMERYAELIDDQLIERLADDRQQAWRFVYEKYRPMVIQYVRKHSGQEADAEDLYHEVLANFRTYLDQPTGNNLGALINRFTVYTWRYWLRQGRKEKTVVMPARVDLGRYWLRQGRKGPHLHEDMASFDRSDEAVDDFFFRSELAEQAIGQLSERCQEMIYARYHTHKTTMEEIAQEHGFSSAKVAKNELYKCMEKARKLVKYALHDR